MFIRATILSVGADSARVVLTGAVPPSIGYESLGNTQVTTRFKAQYKQLEQVGADIAAASTAGTQ